MSKHDDICKYLKKYNTMYIKIESEECLKLIHDLFINNIQPVDYNNAEYFLYLGTYYRIKNNYIKMIRYYQMASELGNNNAMVELGWYYYNINNIDNMKKYYLMAIELGNSVAMTKLGRYYYFYEKDYVSMLKYYLMAIELGNSDAMCKLGEYYHFIDDDENLLKYFLMAIDLGNSESMYKLGWYYYKQKDYDNMLKYFMMSLYTDKKCIRLISYILDDVFEELNNKQIELLLDYRHILNKNNLKILEKKIEDGDIIEHMIKCAHKLH